MLKRNGIYLVGSLFILMIIAGCSTKKNTAGSRFYHSFTTRFNVFFNASEAYKQGVKAIETGNKDNYQETLPLYPIGNKKTVGIGAGDFDRAIEKSQKAIKRHSIKKKPVRKPGKSKDPKYKKWLAQKEYNPFLHRAWMLMGKAQFNKGEFLEAATTFLYIARLYHTNPQVMADARIWAARCYTEMDWFYDAEDALGKVNNDSLPSSLIPEHSSVYGNYLLRQKRFKEAVPYLLTTIRNEKNKRQKAREYYLLGQVYQHIGDNANAFQAYGKVSRLSPPYELEFNSKIKQTEVVSNKNSESIIKQLHRMARNKKNGEYLDQIYYAIGNVYLAKQDTIHAIEQYKIGVEKSTRGGLEKGLILLTLGNIYWQQADYVQAQKCYAEVIGLLDKEHSAYAEVNKRSEVLDELVTHVVSVQLQDSLQHLATLSEAERMRIVEKIIEELKKKEEEEKKEAEHQALMEKREEMMGDNSFGNNNNRPAAPKPIVPTGDKSWYFYNQQLLTQGKASFQRKWGRRKLEDNWNRRNKTVIAGEEFAKVNYDEEEKKQTDSIATDGIGTDSLSTDTVITDTKNPQFYLQQIPVTEEMMKESNDILSDGLFNMGMIYKDKLEDYRLAEQAFNRLYTRFSNYKALDEAYYNLYLMLARQKKMTQANECKSTLIKLFPESKYSITLSDPDYAYNIIHGKHLEDSLYTLTYAAYSEGNYQKVKNNYLTASKKYAMGQHLPKFMFLNAMSMLQTGEKDKFMNALKEVVEKYPKDEISELAAYMVKGLQDGRLLASDGSALGSIWKRRKTDAAKGELSTDSLLPTFSTERNTPYLFMLAYEDGKVNENLLLYEIARYNFSNFIVKNFDLSFVKENGIAMLQIKEFTNFDEAYQYHKLLYADKGMAKKLSGMRVVIISLSNFEILKKYYSFDDYATFHEKNFSTIPEPEIDGYTLDDPIYKEELPQEEE